MGALGPRRVILDAGALIALERGARDVALIVREADQVVIPAGALAQAWRNPATQVNIARAVKAANCLVQALDEADARAIGIICERTGCDDVIDASVALTARRFNATTITSDPEDLRRVDPRIELYVC